MPNTLEIVPIPQIPPPYFRVVFLCLVYAISMHGDSAGARDKVSECNLYLPLKRTQHLIARFSVGNEQYLVVGANNFAFAEDAMDVYKIGNDGSSIKPVDFLTEHGGKGDVRGVYQEGNKIILAGLEGIFIVGNMHVSPHWVPSKAIYADRPKIIGLEHESGTFGYSSPVARISGGLFLLVGEDCLYSVDLNGDSQPKLILSGGLFAVSAAIKENGAGPPDSLVISTSEGTFYVDLRGGKRFGPFDVDSVYGSYDRGNYSVWLTARGIYTFHPGDALPKRISTSSQYSSDIQETEKYIWFSGEGGRTLRWKKGMPDPAEELEVTWGAIYEDAKNGVVWLYSDSHLYLVANGGASPPSKLSTVIPDHLNLVFGKTATWIVTPAAIYSWHADQPTEFQLWKKGIHFRRTGNDILVSVDAGTAYFTPGADPVVLDVPIEKIRDFISTEQKNWLLSDSGVVYWNKGSTASLKTLSIAVGDASRLSIVESGDDAVLKIDDRPLRLSLRTAVVSEMPLQTGGNPGSINGDPNRWVESDIAPAIYAERVRNSLPPWSPRVIFKSRIPRNIEISQEVAMTWTVENYQCRADTNSLKQTVVVTDGGSDKLVSNSSQYIEQQGGVFHVAIRDLKSRSDYRITLTIRDVFGFAKEESFDVSAGKTVKEMLLYSAKLAIAGASVVSFCVFFILAIGARWSQRCFDILMDPIFRRIGLYFGPAIRYVRPIRLWVFEGYFRRVKATLIAEHQYLPVWLHGAEGQKIQSTQLLVEVPRRRAIWIMGPPGTGKSELLLELMRSYFSERSLRAAWQSHHFIPLLVTVREFANIAGGSSDWVSEAARLSLRAYGLRFDDATFFASLMATGDFAVLLDGMNETSREAELRQWLSQNRVARLLATSQGPIAAAGVEMWSLVPLSIAEANALLDIFVEDVDVELRHSVQAVLSHISTPYDIWLIANLIEHGKAVPMDRAGLYSESLMLARTSGQHTFAEEPICRLAFNLWKSGARLFTADGQVTSEMIISLSFARVVVPRGTGFEFRHDLMRGYLAARWLVTYATSVAQTQVRLESDEIWDLSPAEQDSVFPFVAALCDARSTLRELLAIAMTRPSQRARLIDAVQGVVTKSGQKLLFEFADLD